MLTRFLEKFGTPDVLLICGDHVAHNVSASTEQDDPTGSAYAAVKTHIAAVYQIVSEYFPNTIVMPTIGNNDGRYHSMAIDEDDK
jgi:hypothetical protein